MAGNRITFQIQGLPENNGDVLLEDFIKQLDAIKETLGEVERVVSNGNGLRDEAIEYRVVELRHQSPAVIGLEAVTKNSNLEIGKPELVINRFLAGVQQINDTNTGPEDFDYEALQSFSHLTYLVGKGVSQIRIFNSDDTLNLALTAPLAPKVEKILGPDLIEYGAVTGTLEAINLHSTPNVFYLYPTIGRGRIRCIFPVTLRAAAVGALGNYVEVYGRLKFKLSGARPYEVEVNEIEIYPDEDELPKLSDLRGIDPDILPQGKSSQEYLEEIRNEWE